MDERHIELARQAVALLRDALAGEVIQDRPRLLRFITDSASSKDRATAGLAVHLLLGRCVEPSNLEHELDYLDSFLAERMADRLLEGVDFDQLDCSG
jgi:hypothetical protein